MPLALWIFLCLGLSVQAQPLQLPTANRAIFEAGGESRYFAGTAGKSWTSGTFGCVRSDGRQLHEGIDVKSIQHDRYGEPSDPVFAAADGVVAYINPRPSLSNYGKYLVLKHNLDGLETYSLYAHLREIRAGLREGQNVKAGEAIGIMGRTANTREGISKDRAHVHFELNLFINDRFPAWYKKASPGQRNDHGQWNGQNLVGLDPRLVFLAQKSQGRDFNFLNFVRQQTALCRVFARARPFPWLRRYALLAQRNPVAEREGTAGYEIALNYCGLPFELIPRAASEVKHRLSAKYQLLSVNAREQDKNPARHLVTRHGNRWELSVAGVRLLDLLTY